MYQRLIEWHNLRRLSVRRPIFTTPPQMARCCLFWFSLPGPCITFCVCQRYGHNIYLYMLLHTPSIIFATHYLSLIWAQEKPLIFWQYFTCLLWFCLPTHLDHLCPCCRHGHNINIQIFLYTPCIILTTHYLPRTWTPKKLLIFWQHVD